MSRLLRVVKQHPLITFFVLTYALSWLAWPMWASGLYPIAPVFSFAPFLAALVVLAVTHGKSGVGGLLRRMVRWRVGLRWYAVALLIPAGITSAAAVLNVLLGAQAPSSAELGGWTGLLPGFAIALLIPGLGGAWEEPGWRGFALPRLQSGRSAVFAALILGVLIAGWHLPLMFVGQVHYSDIVTIVGAVIIFNWVLQQRQRERADHHAHARHEQRHLGQLLLPYVLWGRFGEAGVVAGSGVVCGGDRGGSLGRACTSLPQAP
jgi:uncharacterized protein